jgi:superfamily II RNA helicase
LLLCFLSELYTAQQLGVLEPVALAIFVAAIVFEPRPRTPSPKPHRWSKRLAHLCHEPLARIHKAETRFRITPKTKAPAFHLAHAMDAWMSHAPFDQLTKLCDVDEGEIVRYFRMTVQLLRELADSPVGDERLKATAEKAWRRINRDVIDAETQLRLS